MKTKTLFAIIASVFCAQLVSAQSTAFTYQGRLTDADSPAGGSYDLRFALWDDATGGTLVAGPVTNRPVAVSNGLFTVTLNFGGEAFNGGSRWLAIGVRPFGNVNAYTALAPRQPIDSTPYAIQAATAAALKGTLPDAQLTANIARLNGSNFFNGPVNFNPASGAPFAISGASSNKLIKGLNADRLGGLDANGFWKTGGNTGTTPGTNFLGTTDNQALDFKVNGQRALRLDPNLTSPNMIAGSSANVVEPGISGATIGGGGATFFAGVPRPNRIAASFSVIGGGLGNSIESGATYSTIAGGVANTIQPGAGDCTIGGGDGNVIEGFSRHSTIAGGRWNTINAYGASISGGSSNLARGYLSAASGYRARALHAGSFVWGDWTEADFASTAANQFLIRASGGVGIGTTTPGQNLTISGTAGPTLGLRRGDNGRTFTMATHDVFGGGSFDAPLSDAETGQIAFKFSRNSVNDLLLMLGNGDLGIGTFPTDKLDVRGNIRLSSGNKSILFSDDGNYDFSIVHNGGASLDFRSPEFGGGTTIASFMNNGNVGIGTTSPVDRLHVNGNVLIEHSGLGLDLRRAGYDEWLIGQIGTGLSIKNQTDNRTDLLIDESGNVGIGINSPSMRLEVAGQLGVFRPDQPNRKLSLDYFGGVARLNLNTTGDSLQITKAGTDVLTIDNANNVGIGTTSPQATLHINHAGRPDAIIFSKGEADVPRMVLGHGPDRRNSEVSYFSSSKAGDASYLPMTFWTGDQERMRIAPNGNVGIGPNEDNVPTPTALLHVHGDQPVVRIQQNPGISGGPTLELSGAGGSDNKVRIIMHSVTLESASGGGGDYLKVRNDNHGDIAYFGSDGKVGIGTTDPHGSLHVHGGHVLVTGVNPSIEMDSNSVGTNRIAILSLATIGGAGVGGSQPNDTVLVARETGNLLFGIGYSEKMRIDVNGTVTAQTFTPLSDRNVKSKFGTVNSRDVLERVASMPIQSWTFTNDTSGARHIGPMAQDFHAAFGLGADDKHIATVDADGVALAAIQGLNQIVQEKDAEIQELKKSVAELKAMVMQFTGKHQAGKE